ncbi:hypothetical protein SDC9_150289 [bioreactor metagenome]|uniref:Uncharacterized protein n=1 Tax=bioreactor metagenome TaxID=1076179 RepID=A0A645ENP5_9ZZZZ
MRLAQRGGRDRDVPVAQVHDLLHHLVDNVVAFPEVVVEGDGHAVPKSHRFDRLPDGGLHLGVLL